MTRDEVYSLLREANLPNPRGDYLELSISDLQRLAVLISKQERIRCSKLADEMKVGILLGWTCYVDNVAEVLVERSL